VALILAAVGALNALGQATPATDPKTEPATPPATAPATPPATPQPAPAPPATQENPVDAKLVYVKLSTSMGDIVLELDNEKAPLSTQNFLAYVKKGHYDGTIFHRVIDGFMIQGGGFTPDLKQKPTDKPIKNEWKNGLRNTRGTVAMARTGQVVDSATSQFFINVADNAFLDQPKATAPRTPSSARSSRHGGR
jgi:cyclophilin family peptidyl-prolyl cis-trans isomerase